MIITIDGLSATGKSTVAKRLAHTLHYLYFNTGLVPRVPTLIFGLILLVISILLWITGIILQVIVKKQRQLFELYLNTLESRNKK